MYSILAQNLLVPFYDLVTGTNRYKCEKVLAKTQYLPKREIQTAQTENLHSLIKHAYETVPYYNHVFKQRGLKPENIRTAEDLTKLPILDKNVIRENFENLISKAIPRSQLIPYRTGGTGSPLRFYITKDQKSWEVAAEYRAYSWADYKLGDRCLMFWGSPIDRQKQNKIFRKVTHFLERTVLIDPWILSDATLEGFAHILNELKPKIVRGYAGPIYTVARYMLENSNVSAQPKAVITSAETLFPHMRKTIEKAFGCKVFDYYGSREVGAIASECEEHCGYHLSAENTVLEFVRKNEHVDTGESGKILITSLRNYGMPFIRYENGDVGKPSNDDCTCGRRLPIMKSIEGRASQFLGAYDRKTNKVVPVDASVLMDFLMIHFKYPLASFRIVQNDLEHVTVNLVKGKQSLEEDTNFLVRQLRNYLGNDVEIDIQFVDNLPPLPSGKRSPLISKINVFE